MKKYNRFFGISGLLVMITLISSCTSETPFYNEGEGLVKMDVNVNSRVTRASIEGDELESLLKNCKIYITGQAGVLHKWIGSQNLPSEGVYLRYGTYLAEAFAGDSLAASFNNKYYKGATKFSLNNENPVTQVSINCRIANVVTSIDENSFDPSIFSEINVKVYNSKGELTFTKDKIMEKGYFMMPWGESIISYRITGKDSKGNEFKEITGTRDVLPAHEYRFKFKTDGTGSNPTGGVLFDIEIEEYSLLEESDVIIYSKPSFSWTNGQSIDKQLVNTEKSFVSETLNVGAYYGFNNLRLTTEDQEISKTIGYSYDIIKDGKENSNLNELSSKGINVTSSSVADGIYKYYITFEGNWLNSLPEKNTEYIINVYAEDKSSNKKSNSMKVRIANKNEAIILEDPITFDVNFANKNLLAVGATKVSIPVIFSDDLEYNDLSVKYKPKTESNWIIVSINNNKTRSGDAIIELSGLKDNTEYEFKFVAGLKEDDSCDFESTTGYFKTEQKFVLPNSDMELWCQPDGKAWIPMPSEDQEFWDTGNKGSTAIGASNNLTTQSTDYKHSGLYSACLKSKTIATVLGAGNIYSGSFLGRVGLTNAKVQFGRPYNCSHPSGLKVYVRYSPGKVSKNSDHFSNGDNDKGQIFIALATEPTIVNTQEKKYFDKDSPNILAYGDIIWNEKVEPTSGDLQEVYIPLVYRDVAATTVPNYLIIVCSASMYGDYFEGADGSVMYVDDFELVYE